MTTNTLTNAMNSSFATCPSLRGQRVFITVFGIGRWGDGAMCTAQEFKVDAVWN